VSFPARIGRYALIVGGTGLGVSVVGIALFGKEQFFRSYLLGFVYWFGIAFGCLGIQMIHALTGGRWGMAARRPLYAASMTLPVLAALFVPILIGLPSLYPWARPEAVNDHLIQHKAAYLNVPFFIGRAVFCFALWCGLARILYRRSLRAGIDRPPTGKMRVLSGPGLLACALTMTVASIDWLMSLDPHWFSTMFSVLLIGGQLLSAMAFVIAMVLLDAKQRDAEVSRDALNDLGNLLLLFVMLWAYFSFSQYLIIYSGNIAEDIPWYVYRTEGGWQHIALALIVLHFAIPLLVLVSRRSKRSPTVLGSLAGFILVMRLVEYYWFIAPNFHHHHIQAHPLDLLLPIGIGGVWLFWFLKQLGRKELAPAG
jgi:hypothetical protein